MDHCYLQTQHQIVLFQRLSYSKTGLRDLGARGGIFINPRLLEIVSRVRINGQCPRRSAWRCVTLCDWFGGWLGRVCGGGLYLPNRANGSRIYSKKAKKKFE